MEPNLESVDSLNVDILQTAVTFFNDNILLSEHSSIAS